jgi:hypothetical protein
VAALREPIKRARVVSDLYHAADLIRAHRGANNLAAEVERIADRIAPSSDANLRVIPSWRSRNEMQTLYYAVA